MYCVGATGAIAPVNKSRGESLRGRNGLSRLPVGQCETEGLRCLDKPFFRVFYKVLLNKAVGFSAVLLVFAWGK